jgi:HEAT repeat protein
MDMPKLLTDTQMQSFLVDGFLLFEPEIPQAMHERISASLNQIIDVEANPGNNVLPRVPEMRHVLNCPEVRGALISVLGPDFIEHPHRYCHSLRPASETLSDAEADEKMRKQTHQDGYTPLGHPRQHYLRYARVMYYPQDTPLELGPTHLIPGSQFNKALTDEDKGRLIPWVAKAGSVMVSHFDIGHAAGVSSASAFRQMIKFIYLRAAEPSTPTWDCQSTDWHMPAQVQAPHNLELVWSHSWDWLCGKQNRYASWQQQHSVASDQIPGLIDELSADKDIEVRLSAAQRLAAAGAAAEPAVQALVSLLSVDHQAMRVAATYALGAIGKGAILPLLEQLQQAGIREEENSTSWSEGAVAMEDAAHALGAIGADAVEPLRQVLRAGEGWASINAAFALAEMDSVAAAAVPDLIAQLQSSSHRLVRTVLDSLGSIRTDVPVHEIAALFSADRPGWDEEIHRWWSPLDGVRTHAAMALARLGADSAPAEAELLAALDQPCGHAACFALLALQRIGSPRATAAAMDFLMSQRWDASVDGERQF